MYRFSNIKLLDELDFASIGKEDVWETGIGILVLANFHLLFEEGSHEVHDRMLGHYVHMYSALLYEWFNSGIINVYEKDGSKIQECGDAIIANYDVDKPILTLISAFVKKVELKEAVKNHTKLNINHLESLLSGHQHKLHIVAESKSEAASDAASSRWKTKDEMEVKISRYIEGLLGSGCICDNVQMKNIVWKHFQNDPEVRLLTKAVEAEHKQLGKRPDFSKFLSKDAVLQICRKVYKSKAPDRIYKVTLHKRVKGCQAHS